MRRSATRPPLLLCLALLLAACSGARGEPSASPPTAPPTREAALAPTATRTPRPPTAPPVPLDPTPAPTSIVEPSPTPTSPPEADLPRSAGATVLRLGRGIGPGQTGGQPVAFRIGGDGSIRVLDPENHRLLFFDAGGQPQLTVGFDPAATQADFIVSREGEIFVSETLPDASKPDGVRWRIIRYDQKGTALQEIPMDMAAHQLSMNADQALVVEQNGTSHAIVMTKDGEVIPPVGQYLGENNGVATPRSPLFFHFSQNGPQDAYVSVSTETLFQATVQLQVPAGMTHFANIDRAMNLYVRSPVGGDTISFARMAPDGAYLGGVTIAEPGCALDLRNTYIDQAGTAWTMCGDGEATVIKRYRLEDPQGQQLADVPSEPADVAWKPGAEIKLTAA